MPGNKGIWEPVGSGHIGCGAGVTLLRPRTKASGIKPSGLRVEQAHVWRRYGQRRGGNVEGDHLATTGAPCHSVPGGIFSPRSTTERPLTEQPAPSVVSGRTALLGPS